MCVLSQDSSSAGESYSSSRAEIVHTSFESEAQISNKTVWRIMLNRLLCYNIIFWHVNDMTHKKNIKHNIEQNGGENKAE